MSAFSNEKLASIDNTLSSFLNPAGFESHPFLVGWYNENVSKPFKLLYPVDTLCYVVLSRPAMFERTFLPYLLQGESLLDHKQDILDVCLRQFFEGILEKLEGCGDIELIQDFNLTPTRRPKILLQTAGHVSGATRFFQNSDVFHPPWEDSKRIFGVCLHPDFGGWFALRAVFILKDRMAPHLVQKTPRDLNLTQEQIAKLLLLFNDHWKDGRYRDIIPVKEKYSPLQQLYFATKPSERKELLRNHFQLN